MLRTRLERATVDAILDTTRHRDILAMVPAADLTVLINAELDALAVDFQRLADQIRAEAAMFAQPGRFLLADTSFYIRHPRRFDDVDYATLLGDARGIPIHLLVPILVVDELDGLKQHSAKHQRWRARYTLAALDKLLTHPETVVTLREAEMEAGKGQVTVQLILDPPGHVRLPINDDELIDVAAACQRYVAPGRWGITVVTYDTGQSTRARVAGLDVRKLQEPPEGEEPANS